MIRRLAPLAVALAAALAVGGCVTLFPKAEPAQLYRFGGSIQSPAGPVAARVTVLADTMDFDRESASDRILTVSGDEVAYVKGARWAAAASTLFRQALLRAFEAGGGPAQLVDRGQSAKIDQVLRLDVTRFEARYASAGAAPTVVVRVRALLTNYGDRAIIGQRVFEADVDAGDNRMGAIATAFDHAAAQVLGQIVAWVNQGGQG